MPLTLIIYVKNHLQIKYKQIFLLFYKKSATENWARVKDGSENPLCFFFKNTKIAVYSLTRSFSRRDTPTLWLRSA